MLQLGWFILACVLVAIFVLIVGVVLHAYFMSKRDDILAEGATSGTASADAAPPLLAGKRYNIQLSHGRVLENITFVGMSKPASDLPWEMQQWLVGQKVDGTQVYFLPRSIRVVEDAA